MTQEQKRIKIAEACGWRRKGRNKIWESPNPLEGWEWSSGLPNYFSDLNAMHEAEKLIMDESSITYYAHLSRLSCPWHATAAQRAEAFGKTLSLW